MGFMGALGGLVDVGAPYQRPRSALYLVRAYQLRSARAVAARTRRTMRSLDLNSKTLDEAVTRNARG